VNILITGGAGYVGGTVAKLLVARGHTVIVYDNLCHAKAAMVPEGVTFIEGDVADTKRLEKIFEERSVAGVMHFAALIEAGESMQKPELYFRNNTASTLGLLEAMVNKKLQKLVFSSTAAVYGEPKSTPIREDAELAPTNAYGESKLLVEQMLGWIQRIHGLHYALDTAYFGCCAGAQEKYQGIWPGLPHGGRYLHPRLHSCAGSGGSASAGARGAGDAGTDDLQHW
jgi:UDP-glucose 4-epimerase